MAQNTHNSFSKTQQFQFKQPSLNSTKSNFNNPSIISIIDKSLKHLNQISEANIVAQQLYIELLKQKKTMKFDQIKKIYFTLTEGKAKDKKQLLQTDYQNHQSLLRLCWRSLQKLVKKITYYMINQNKLSIISKSVLKLIHLNQQFVRRFQKLRNSSMLFILEIIQKLIQENSILQNKIYQILLNRGYVVSLDQFYKLNGYDAQHRQAYYAKQGIPQQKQQSSSDDQPENPVVLQKKQSTISSRKHTIRKKKGFRIDCRYSWKQKIFQAVQLQSKEKQKYPPNKTNFQIRQSFQKFIDDFLQNDSLNQILLKYSSQENENKKQKSIQKGQKVPNYSNTDTLIHKKIFESKMESVINQLKTNNIKISSKILQIMNNSSDEAINSKINSGQKKYITQRKNSQKRQSSNLLAVQRKLRQSSTINDRKIINQNFFRQLLRRNTNIQNYLNQQILDKQKFKQQFIETNFSKPSHKKVNPNIIQFFQSNQNQSFENLNDKNKIKQVSQFSQLKPGKAMFLFNKNSQKDNFNHIQNQSEHKEKSISKNKYLQKQLNHKYQILPRKDFQSKNNIQGLKNQSVAQKIRILKQQVQLRNQKSILQAIQNSAFEPGNFAKFAQILQNLNKRKPSVLLKSQLQSQSLKQNMVPFKKKSQVFNRRTINRSHTEFGQTIKQINMGNQCTFIQGKQLAKQIINKNRLKTVESVGINKQKILDQIKSDKKNHKNTNCGYNLPSKRYQVYDRRLRRFVTEN